MNTILKEYGDTILAILTAGALLLILFAMKEPLGRIFLADLSGLGRFL